MRGLMVAVALVMAGAAVARDYTPEEKTCALVMIRSARIEGTVTDIRLKSAGGLETASRLAAAYRSALRAAAAVDAWGTIMSPANSDRLESAEARGGEGAARKVFTEIFVAAGLTAYDLDVEMVESGLKNNVSGVCLVNYRGRVFAVPAPPPGR